MSREAQVRICGGLGVKFPGSTRPFRLIEKGGRKEDRRVIVRPTHKKRTKFLREVKILLTSNPFKPVEEVVTQLLNPKIRGWVNFFRHFNAGRDLKFVGWQIEIKIRRFASRQTPVKRGGTSWTTWTRDEIYGKWGLHSNYRVYRGETT